MKMRSKGPRELRQRFERRPEAQIDDRSQSGTFYVGARHRGMFGIGLERDQPAVGRQGSCQPDRAIAAERADFEDSARVLNARQNMQELALVWRNRDGRQAGRIARSQRRGEDRILADEQIADVIIDSQPLRFAHKGSLIRHFKAEGNLRADLS